MQAPLLAFVLYNANSDCARVATASPRNNDGLPNLTSLIKGRRLTPICPSVHYVHLTTLLFLFVHLFHIL